MVVADIPKRERPPETIRISLVPIGAGYADLRVYRGGLPTRQGLEIHRDLMAPVLDALMGLQPAAFSWSLSGRASV